MSERRFDVSQIDLRVNGILVPWSRYAVVFSRPDYDVIIDDPVIGEVRLHDGFDLEMREGEQAWCQVTLCELKRILVARDEQMRAANLPNASEALERKLFNRLDDFDCHRGGTRSILRAGHAECIRRVQRLLYEVGIPHIVDGSLFTVPDAERARSILRRAGFRASTISPQTLIEPHGEVAIKFVER